MSQHLIIDNLHVSVEKNRILNGVSLDIAQGEIHALMGPNGSGKSTLSNVLMGHPSYVADKGSVKLNGTDILKLSPDERARAGLYLAFQYPLELPGVSVANFLRMAYNARRGSNNHVGVRDFVKLLKKKAKLLHIDEAFIERPLNEGFSGGEKKKMEILQMAILKPTFAILDETDSGLDVDALRVVANGINTCAGNKIGILLITHYSRILKHVTPDRIHILVDGKIVKSGGSDLAHTIDEQGYAQFTKSDKS